jgi:hypothetical protein
MSTFFPISLITAGVGGAVFFALQAFLDSSTEYVILFACACIVACIGWQELRETLDFNEGQ